MFLQMLLHTQTVFAEPNEDSEKKVNSEINETEIQAFYDVKKEEDTGITIDLLAEEEFEMDLSGVSAAPVTITTSEALNISTDTEMATTEAPPVETLEWDLDLTEDIEIGDQNLKISPEPKSEPVNLDFLDEDEAGEEEE